MKGIITEKGETKRLIITNSILEEIYELQKVCESWDDKKLLEGYEFEPDYFHKCLTAGDLPPVPGASNEFYRMKSIYLKETGKLIGFFDMYHGYPSEESAWISIFVIGKDYRKNGYAQEAIDFLTAECIRIGYEKVRIGVYLKNWRGLRFWTKAGFNKIFGIFGDETYSENTFALIGLEKSLLCSMSLHDKV